MYPGHWAGIQPQAPAAIDAATGDSLTWAQLDARSNRIARWLAGRGLVPGDHVALFMENQLEFFAVCWAALRSGLYLTCVNRYFTAEEVAYVVNDSAAKVVITSAALADVACRVPPLCPDVEAWLMVDGVRDGFMPFEESIALEPAEPLASEPAGDFMLYSSGTTGRPKGIKRPLGGASIRDGVRNAEAFRQRYGFGPGSIYLSPAPLYHAAPLAYCMGAQSLGSTVVMMRKFDALEALELIERHRITHSQWVPTMFVRMLKLTEAERSRFDLSSHQVAIHAAAPCPVEVKRQMIEWWGPILGEYYAGTEGNGSTYISSEEWLERPGSVGRASRGVLHICDEEGNEMPVGESGLVYFEQDMVTFEYHNAPDKTRSSQHPLHPNWSTLGDVGYLDEAGYLFLTDRQAFMIISGGVNIYPQEVEDALVLHEKVADVAVFGVPDPDFGEAVKAVVEPALGVEPGPDLERELLGFARERLAHFMVPRSVDFIDTMPRLPTGKLYKRLLKDRYWGKSGGTIV